MRVLGNAGRRAFGGGSGIQGQADPLVVPIRFALIRIKRDVQPGRKTIHKETVMTHTAKQFLTELSDDYDTVVKALGRMAKNIGEHGDDAVVESAQSFVHSASVLAEKIKKQSTNLAKAAGEEVREHPIATAALAAAAVGLLGYAVTHTGKR